jgi:hypothetical protein
MTRLAIFATALLAGCATTAHIATEPTVRTVEVRVPVAQPCPALERIGPRPIYPDTAAAIAAAPDIAAKVGLLLAGRILRMAREDAAEAAMRACENPS